MQDITANKKSKRISSSQLKLIAIVLMFIDHIGAILIDGYFYETGILVDNMFTITREAPMFSMVEKLYYIDIALRLIGRLAFPLFAFLLVQGFMHTRSKKKYLIRLLIFALISELPFGLVMAVIHQPSRNVFFTLSLGFMAIWGIEYIDSKGAASKKEVASAAPDAPSEEAGNDGSASAAGGILTKALVSPSSRNFLTIIWLAACCGLAALIKSDYSSFGVLTIVALYIFRREPVKSMAIACAILTLLGGLIEFPAFLNLLLIRRYNGEKGRPLFGKYFFYAFYPVHMLLLYCILQLIVR